MWFIEAGFVLKTTLKFDPHTLFGGYNIEQTLHAKIAK